MRLGSLFSGYGGLDLAVSTVLPATTAWVSDIEPGPQRILAHHWPDVPNLGDVTSVDWAAVEPVDIIAGGSPCQDLSLAGQRAGMRPGTRSGLWESMLHAIATIRPSLVIWENVRGALSAPAFSLLESREGRLGDRTRRPALRALGRVLGDLASIGYDAAWAGIRASDVGAPHGRYRVFMLAWPAADTEGDPGWLRDRDGGVAADTGGAGAGLTLLRTPTAQLAVNGGSQHPDKRREGGHGPTLADEVEHLLPTHVVNDMGRAYTPETWDEWTARLKASHGNGNGHGDSLSVEALRMLPTPQAHDAQDGKTPDQVAAMRARGHGVRNLNETAANELAALLPSAVLLPTPTAGDAKSSRNSTATRHVLPPTGIHAGDTLTDVTVPKPGGDPLTFGQYAPAIARWEAVTRPAPAPTEPTGKGGAHRLSPRFVEWMMGLPDGWVTDIPDLSHNAQLRALGNGVVPQQGAAAIRHLLGIVRAEVVA